MSWTTDDAWQICGDLLQSLMNALPGIAWEKQGADGYDGVIYFTNQFGGRARITISRDALQDYLEADSQSQSLMAHKLVVCIKSIDESGLRQGVIRSDHLAL